jgi:hypothetical protein
VGDGVVDSQLDEVSATGTHISMMCPDNVQQGTLRC